MQKHLEAPSRTIVDSHLVLQNLRPVFENFGNARVIRPHGCLNHLLRPLVQRLGFSVFALRGEARARDRQNQGSCTSLRESKCSTTPPGYLGIRTKRVSTRVATLYVKRSWQFPWLSLTLSTSQNTKGHGEKKLGKFRRLSPSRSTTSPVLEPCGKMMVVGGQWLPTNLNTSKV